MPTNAGYCAACGRELGQVFRNAAQAVPGTGFSPRISDPAFKRYIKNSYRWSIIFSSFMAVAAVVGFYIAGETGAEMSNPESLYIGFVIGGIFLAIAC